VDVRGTLAPAQMVDSRLAVLLRSTETGAFNQAPRDRPHHLTGGRGGPPVPASASRPYSGGPPGSAGFDNNVGPGQPSSKARYRKGVRALFQAEITDEQRHAQLTGQTRRAWQTRSRCHWTNCCSDQNPIQRPSPSHAWQRSSRPGTVEGWPACFGARPPRDRRSRSLPASQGDSRGRGEGEIEWQRTCAV
jgi:hypothetical protein